MNLQFCWALIVLLASSFDVALGEQGGLRHLQIDEASENVTTPEINDTIVVTNETLVPTPEETEDGEGGEEIDVDDGEDEETTETPTMGSTTPQPTTEAPSTPQPTTLAPTTGMPTLAPVAPVPPSDLCINAGGPIQITPPSLDGSLEMIVQGTTDGATKQTLDRCGTYVTGPGVWYYVSGNGATVTATTCWNGTTLDTKISVFGGTCNSLTCIGGNDDAEHGCSISASSSEYKWQTVFGESYYLLVHGIGNSVGDFELSVHGSHDQCQYAIALSVGDTTSGSIAGAATPFGGIIQNCGDAGALGQAPGVWYSIAGTGSAVKVTVCPDQSNGRPFSVHVFESSCQDSNSCIGGNAPFSGCSVHEWDTDSGTTYYILVHNFAFPGNGIFSMTVESAGFSVVRRRPIFD